MTQNKSKYSGIIFLNLVVFFIAASSFGQQLNFNEKTFRGRFTEITPPDVDRMPKVFNETISFTNDKVLSDFLKGYDVGEVTYLMEVDDRRAVAVDVWVLKFSADGTRDGEKVHFEFQGDIMSHDHLSGELVIAYPDRTQEKYLLEAAAVQK